MYNYLKLKYKSITQKKISYSYNGVDSLINNIFKNKKKGIYVDVGCNHPIKNNNTYLLYKRGWNGINIDVDAKNIKIFNYARSRDHNVNIAVSDKNGFENLFYYHECSPINTLSKEVSNYQKAKISKVIDNVIKSNLYKFIISKNYTLANWLHSDLVFISNNFRD